MVINHNIRAMVAQHALFQNNNAMGKSLEKLSTGLRINRAQDDAAGLAMSEQMRTQIRGLGKAKQNTQDGIAALQIAEGGLSEISNIMQRQRELAIQSANDTLTSTERKYLDDEFQQLSKEIRRISETTDYNGKNMLNFTTDPNSSFGAIGKEASVARIAQAMKDGYNALESMLDKFGEDELEGDYSSGRAKDAADAFNEVVKQSAILKDIMANASTDKELVEQQGAISNVMGSILSKLKGLEDLFMLDSDVFISDPDSGIADDEKVKAAHGDNAHDSFTKLKNALHDLKDAADVKEGDVLQNVGNKAASYTLHVGSSYSKGIGGVNANEITLTYLALDIKSLKIERQYITTQWGSGEAIDQIDKVIKEVSGARAKIGTFINRLEYTANNIANLEFNTQDAESRIRDTNFAAETTEFTRNQIMVQSATSILAQANSLPQSVLGLLG